MASNREGGVKIFKGTSTDNLEDLMNQFLSGNGSQEDPRKEILLAPAFFTSGGSFYCLIYFRRALNSGGKQ